MFRNSNKIPVGGDRAGPLNSTKFLKLKKNNMLKRVIKAEPENVLRRYLAMLLTVVTFITAIPLSNLMTAKAVDEYNYSLTVTIDLDGGECDDIYYKSNVDRDGCGYSGGQWVDKLGIGKTFLDRTSTPHTVIGRGADTPCEGTFTVRADAVGITPHVVISTPTRDGYTFEGWDTNTDTREYDGDTAFEVGAYAPDNITITATWSKNEPDTSNMTISWDSGVDYVGADGYSSDYDFTFSGQDHNFPTGSTLQLNAHIKDGYSIVGFQEDAVSPGFIWNDYWTNANYPGVIFDSWSMNSNRSIKVLTKTTLSFSYDDGFTNSSHTETVNTDSAYKDYPKFKENYELDYVEDLDTGDKWYSYDGKDSKGSYTSWTAYKPRRIRYHSKLAEGAKLTLNLDQNGATTKGTERVDVYHNIKISDVTIPKKEYTATFFDGNKKVHDDIIDKFKFLGYRNDEEGLIHTNTTSKFRDYYRPGSIGSTSTTVTGNATYEGTSTYPVTESGNKVTTTVYAGSGDYSDVNFRLDCYGYEGYVMVSYNGGSDSGESWYVEASTEDESSKEIYSGYDFSADGYGYIYVKDWIEIFVSGDSNDWWTDISVVSVDMTTLKKGYWYDENGKGLINYPLNRNHTIKAVWSGGDITLPEAPAKEGYTFVGWRTEDAKLQTANWSNDDEDYLDCKNNYGGDVAKWFKASREGKAQNDFATNYYLVPNSYYLNDEVMHFQYYYVDYAGDDVGLGKDTKFIACYEEIPKVTLKTSSDKGISRAYIDGNVNTRSLKVYPNTNHTINAELNKGYKFAGWYNGNTLYSYSMSKQITMGDKDMLLVAKSNPINYKIAYNLDGGTLNGKTNPDTYNVETATFTLNNPTRLGYTFAGWSGTDITGTAKIVTVNKGSTGNRTYTATWTPVNYTISYDLNGGAVVVSNPTSYNIETPTFTLNNPVRLGYVFVGWTGSNGTTPQKAVSVYKGSTGNKSYKANWTAADVGYTINHYVMDINGNYPSTPTKTERLSGFTDTSVTAKRLSLGNGFTYPDVQTVKVKADGTTVVNYYYSRNQYYLNLNGYLKQRVSENFADLTETVKDINGKDVKHTFATSVVKVNGSVHAKGNGVTDFYEKVYYGSTYEIITTAKTGYTIIDNTGTFKGTITGDTVVTPHVSINQYTVKYEPNKPSKATNDVTKMADQFVYYNRQRKLTTNTYKYTGYDFTGWNTKADGTGTAYTDGQTIENLSSADGAVITLYAQWKIHTHKLKVYVSNENADGTFGSEWLWQDKILEYNTPYSYTGYVNDTVYQQISTSGTMYDSDITIHLKAMRKTFNQKLTVYYEQPDGSFDAGTVVINKAYRYGQTVSWNRNADVTYKAASISWTVAGANVKELKIYRQQYKIIVNGADKHTTTKGTGTYRYGYELWITAEVEAGYHFINWNMDSSLTESSMKIEVTGDKTYTAYVEANKYLITYNLNKPARASSTPKLNTQNTWEYEYNSKILYMPDKTTTLLTGWTFEGWYTEADGGTKIKVGDIYKWIGNITLYAHWTENTYTIHYESDGGTAINDINVKYEDPVKLSAVPYRPGYIFSYWNTKADASGHSYEGSETVRHLSTSGTVTLYAVWSKKAIAQIGAAVNMTEKNGYVFGHITDDSVSIRTYVIDENGNILIK
jgi:uncharacterized repeat protein (TIGR02543 family)